MPQNFFFFTFFPHSFLWFTVKMLYLSLYPTSINLPLGPHFQVFLVTILNLVSLISDLSNLLNEIHIRSLDLQRPKSLHSMSLS